jgi:hydroxyacylglutathione hydrolase
MELIALPAFVDNYIWMVHDGRKAWVVDPGAAAPVLDSLEARGLELAGILVTHHHGDHVGGLGGLRSVLGGPVVGPAREAIPEPFEPLHAGDVVDVLGARFEVLDVPGHTAGHIANVHDPERHGSPRDGGFGRPVLFCGDTLFSAGCGRLFEGTAGQMHHSLAQLAALPGDTAVCCAHEYTLANLKFALAVEPGNQAARQYHDACQVRRARHEPTLPSSIAIERDVNPFLRCDVPEVIAAVHRRTPSARHPVEVFRTLREWKNEFR